MPITIPNSLPAFTILQEKGVFVMDIHRAESQDIRPLRIGILILMPKKKETEAQILRCIGNGPLQIEPIFLKLNSHTSKNTDSGHLEKFYVSFSEALKNGLDGLIITGAPVEKLDFEEVDYWTELTQIFDISKKYITSTLFLCWSAQAALFHFYKISKKNLSQKVFGIFPHHHSSCRFLLRGVDDEFFAPHSRHTEVSSEDLLHTSEVEILAESEEAGIYLAASPDRSLVYCFGHPEYDRTTLADEYWRDFSKGIPIDIPKHYFPDDDSSQVPKLLWRSNAETLYRNWINFIYQTTPYKLPQTF